MGYNVILNRPFNDEELSIVGKSSSDSIFEKVRTLLSEKYTCVKYLGAGASVTVCGFLPMICFFGGG